METALTAVKVTGLAGFGWILNPPLQIFSCYAVLRVRRGGFHIRLLGAYSSYGGVAQLGEHLPCKQGVSGSIPLISTRGMGS